MLTLSPALNGSPGGALIFFSEPAQAQLAVELFDSHPYAGTFLEVRLTDGAAATKLLAALVHVQHKAGTPAASNGQQVGLLHVPAITSCLCVHTWCMHGDTVNFGGEE